MEGKILLHYINNPIINKLTAPENSLYRPQIHYFKVLFLTCVVVLSTLVFSFLFVYFLKKVDLLEFEDKNQLHIIFNVYLIVQLIVLLISLKYIMIWFVRLYQRYAKSETRLRCCYTPSCSEYAILAIKKYGVLIGGIKTVKRLRRCGPPGGIDYP